MKRVHSDFENNYTLRNFIYFRYLHFISWGKRRLTFLCLLLMSHDCEDGMQEDKDFDM